MLEDAKMIMKKFLCSCKEFINQNLIFHQPIPLRQGEGGEDTKIVGEM